MTSAEKKARELVERWVDAWINCGVECRDSFPTLEEAKKNLCYYDGSKCKGKVIN